MQKKIWLCDDEVSKRFPVYTRANAGEVFAVAVSPLTWTTFGRLAWEIGFREALYDMGVFTPDEFSPAGECEVLGCFGGYIYLNVSVTRLIGVRIPGMTAEAIDASFFGDNTAAPPYRPDPRDENAECSAKVSAWLGSLPESDPKAATDAYRLHIDSLVSNRPDFAKLSDAALLDYFRSLTSESQRLMRRHILNTHGSNVLTGMIAQICQAVGADEFLAKVTAGVGEVDSAGQSFDLWELSRQVKSSPDVTAAFDQGVDGLLDRLRASVDREASRFLEQWDVFIDHWGFLGPDVWEFRSPTYRTNPEMVLRMLNRTRLAPDSAAPKARAATLIAEREAAITEIATRLAGDAAAQAQFTGAARAAGNYLAARERSKVINTRLNDEARSAIRELGQRLVKRGLLSKWADVLMVTNDEADDFVANPAAYTGLIADRTALLEVLMSKEPPFVFEAEPPPLSMFKNRTTGNAGGTKMTRSARLSGAGVSPGRHTGRARVVASLAADSKLEPGEVIVAVTTDSTWGALFLMAGAVVVETGSTISHAAIVSRELGIPAVVSVRNATQQIMDGDTVTVDGNVGTVTVE
ncbi:MAG TPA: PEP-utilizing enzyme [Burkholderiales bacterium]|nr:PEP-utilizing enzyme [Burkholderiales bacterium]